MDQQTHLREYALEWLGKFGELYDEVQGQPSARVVHKMRVAVRRLRSVLTLIEPVKSQAEKLDDELQDLQDRLGECRELDVALKDAKDFSVAPDEIKKRRKKSVRKIRDEFTSQRKEKLEKRLREALLEIDTAKLHPEKALQAFRQDFTQRAKAHPKKAKKLHRLRISAKKFRYALEAVGREAKPLENLQGVIGRMHDMQTLRKLADRKKHKIRKAEKKCKKRALKMVDPVLKQVDQTKA